jgi:tetratricopeptide (TPR) repeat protein
MATQLIIDAETLAAVMQEPPSPAAQLAIQAANYANAGDSLAAANLLAQAETQSPSIAVLFLAFQFYFRSGMHADALRVANARIERCKQHNDARQHARALANLALVHLALNKTDAAFTAATQAFAIDEHSGDALAISRNLGTLAQVHEARAHWHLAHDTYIEALRFAEQTGEPAHIATKIANLGDVCLAQGNRTAAIDYWQRAIPLLQRAGKHTWAAECRAKLDRVLASLTT